MKRLVVMVLLACSAPPPAATPITPPPTTTTQKKTKPMIVQAGHPVLRSRAHEVPPETIGTPDFQALIARMIQTMRDAPGVGLAAPQIGIPWRVIVLEDRAVAMSKLAPAEIAERGRVAFGPRVFVNPTLTPVGTEHATFFEGCLSVEGYTGLVPRALEVEVKGLDEHGAAQTWRVRGWPARILQHEVDHLDGALYVDRMLTRSFMTGDQARARYAGKPIQTVLSELGL